MVEGFRVLRVWVEVEGVVGDVGVIMDKSGEMDENETECHEWTNKFVPYYFNLYFQDACCGGFRTQRCCRWAELNCHFVAPYFATLFNLSFQDADCVGAQFPKALPLG